MIDSELKQVVAFDIAQAFVAENGHLEQRPKKRFYNMIMVELLQNDLEDLESMRDNLDYTLNKGVLSKRYAALANEVQA
tara:strand:- start:718 stop:954 length:237 start_codon:yes stop_codon:yes gene_type:complete